MHNDLNKGLAAALQQKRLDTPRFCYDRDLVMGAIAILFLKCRFPMEIGSNNLLGFMVSPSCNPVCTWVLGHYNDNWFELNVSGETLFCGPVLSASSGPTTCTTATSTRSFLYLLLV